MSIAPQAEPIRKPEYRVRFDRTGTTLGASLHSDLGRRLGIALQSNERIHIFEYLDRLTELDEGLPNRLRPRIERLLQEQREFTLSGDFSVGDEGLHLHISGRIIQGHAGDEVCSLLFLDDTEHTQLRRLYEYMFRLANHELKGPLACIIGAADYADEHVSAGNLDGVKTCLEMIDRNARVLEEMIMRYLNLSRIESGTISLTLDRLRLSEEVLNPVVADLQQALRSKRMHVEFVCDSSDGEPEVLADAEMLEIVLRNLLSNAIQYGNADSVIVVELLPEFTHATVRVTNEGPEIQPSERPRLFEKFTRLDTSRGTKGAGLGLYNTRKIVEFWGGVIDVASGESKTAFWFTIPEPVDAGGGI